MINGGKMVAGVETAGGQEITNGVENGNCERVLAAGL